MNNKSTVLSRLTGITRFTASIIVLSGLGLCSCHSKDQSSTTTADSSKVVAKGDGVGLVKDIDASSHMIRISHNNIPGVMDAMTMAYSVSDTAMLTKVKAGDSVRFTLSEPTLGTYVITGMTVIQK